MLTFVTIRLDGIRTRIDVCKANDLGEPASLVVLGAKGAPIIGEQSVVQSRRDDEAMHSIVEEEQRRVGGGGPTRMVCDFSRAPPSTGELPAIRCIRNPARTPHPSVLFVDLLSSSRSRISGSSSHIAISGPVPFSGALPF